MPYVGRVPSAVPVTADDIPANSIDASKIIDGAIAVADVADNAITEAKIADAAVVSLKSGRKNLIINGGFDVWQRGTTGTAQGYNSADRWYIARGGGSPVVSITRQAFATTETDIKSKYYLQWVQSTGGTTPYIVQRVEEVKPFLGQEVTVSVWMKAASAVTIDLDVYIDYGDAQATTLDENTSFSVTTSWQKFQHTFTISSGGTVAANSNLEVRFSPPDSNTITTYFAEAQLEYGSTATDFEHRSYGEELALCQRYYVNAGFGGNDGAVVSAGRDEQYLHVRVAPTRFPVTMRTTPTVAIQSSSPNCMDRYGRGQETCYPVAEGVSPDGFQGVVKKDSGGSSANWTDSGLYINRAGYKAEAEL